MCHLIYQFAVSRGSPCGSCNLLRTRSGAERAVQLRKYCRLAQMTKKANETEKTTCEFHVTFMYIIVHFIFDPYCIRGFSRLYLGTCWDFPDSIEYGWVVCFDSNAAPFPGWGFLREEACSGGRPTCRVENAARTEIKQQRLLLRNTGISWHQSYTFTRDSFGWLWFDNRWTLPETLAAAFHYQASDIFLLLSCMSATICRESDVRNWHGRTRTQTQAHARSFAAMIDPNPKNTIHIIHSVGSRTVWKHRSLEDVATHHEQCREGVRSLSRR